MQDDVIRGREREEALRSSEARFRAVIENACEAILGVDRTGRILLANPAAGRVFGYPLVELTGAPLAILLPEAARPRHGAALEGYFAHPHDMRMGERSQLTGRRKDGAEVALEISLSYVATADGGMAIALLQDVTERRDSRRRLQSLARRLMVAQQEERRRIARDLHDDLTQTISLLGMKLGFLEQSLDRPREQLLAEIADARRHVDGLVEEVRALSHRLHPTVLEYSGLEGALESLAADWRRHEGVTVRLRLDQGAAPLTGEAASALYHVALEAMRNAVRHGRAKTLDVGLRRDPAALRLVVADDGVGFDTTRPPGDDALGLIGMEERALGLGGRFAIASVPGRGTRVEVEVPIQRGPA